MRVLLLIAILGASCTQGSLSIEDYLQEMESHSDVLNVSSTDQHILATLVYRPLDWRIAMDQKRGIHFDRLEYASTQEFLLTLRPQRGSFDLFSDVTDDEAIRQQRIYYASFEIHRDITCLVAGDTIRSSYVHYERDYSSSPESRFIVQFPDFDEDSDFQIVFAPSISLSPGRAAPYIFHFRENVFENLPKLSAT